MFTTPDPLKLYYAKRGTTQTLDRMHTYLNPLLQICKVIGYESF